MLSCYTVRMKLKHVAGVALAAGLMAGACSSEPTATNEFSGLSIQHPEIKDELARIQTQRQLQVGNHTLFLSSLDNQPLAYDADRVQKAANIFLQIAQSKPTFNAKVATSRGEATWSGTVTERSNTKHFVLGVSKVEDIGDLSRLVPQNITKAFTLAPDESSLPTLSAITFGDRNKIIITGTNKVTAPWNSTVTEECQSLVKIDARADTQAEMQEEICNSIGRLVSTALADDSYEAYQDSVEESPLELGITTYHHVIPYLEFSLEAFNAIKSGTFQPGMLNDYKAAIPKS
jgi:hypothetical protein